MKNIHIKFDYREALEGKKEFVSSQIGTLEMLKEFKDYRISRRRELILKAKLRNALFDLSEAVKRIQEDFPKEEEEETEVEELKKASKKEHKKSNKPFKHESKEVTEKRSLSEELEEIQKKLEKLE